MVESSRRNFQHHVLLQYRHCGKDSEVCTSANFIISWISIFDDPEGGFDIYISIVGRVQICSDKTRGRLMQKAVVVHSVHLVLLNFDQSIVDYPL